jgi:hypothetical protein
MKSRLNMSSVEGVAASLGSVWSESGSGHLVYSRCGLTPQSRGQSAASRTLPLTSNVRPQVDAIMSFDIIVLQPKPDEGLLADLLAVQDAFPLGTPGEIRRQCDQVIPGIAWSSNTGVYEAKEGFAIEFSIPDETHPSSLHLSLYFGSSWETAGSAAFDRAVRRLYESLHWQSFAVSDNSSLLLGDPE